VPSAAGSGRTAGAVPPRGTPTPSSSRKRRCDRAGTESARSRRSAAPPLRRVPPERVAVRGEHPPGVPKIRAPPI
jgi:hypothetical protein